MTFGEKVKNLRKNKGLNQTQLADAVGVSLRTVRGWEIEGRYPKKHDLYQKLADILSCDISYLMTEEEALSLIHICHLFYQSIKSSISF